MPFRPHRSAPWLCVPGIALLALGLLAAFPPAVHAADLTLREAGSTLLYPLFQRWIPDYAAANPGTAITTDATGSGDGIAEAISGHAQIGASDAYMSDEQAEHNRVVVNIPLAIAAQTLMYPLILPLVGRWNERLAAGYGVSEKNQAGGNPAMILLFHTTASPGTAL